MIKSKKIEELENASIKLTISVKKDYIRKTYDELVAEYCKTVRMDGFRKGKVPPNVLLRKYGEAILAETTERIIRNSLDEVLQKVEKRPITTSIPEVDTKKGLELGKDYSYSVTYDTYPDVKLSEYKGQSYEALQVNISDEDMDRELKALQEQNSIVIDKKDTTVLNGDIVNIDYAELDDQDQELPGGKREGFVFEVGSGYNIYKLDNDLVGMKTGEEKVISKDYPEDFEFKGLAGKSKRLKVKLNAVKEKQLPEINDELAQDISDKYENLEDLKKDIRTRLEEYAAQKVREHSISQILEKIAEQTEVPLPKSMVDSELEDQWRRFVSRLGGDEKPVLKQLEAEGRTKEQIQGEWRAGAEKKLKLQLVVNEMVKQENIELEDKEIEERIQKEADAQNIGFEEAKEMMDRNNYLEFLKYDLKNEKLYDILLENGTRRKGKKVKFLDLVQGNY
ncbi:MAG: trigger factor [Spirochaetaceae bacterium]|nr:MAG: trigger factor [Spirochaetaceae bacterium]